jgi:hypothetical protein
MHYVYRLFEAEPLSPRGRFRRYWELARLEWRYGGAEAPKSRELLDVYSYADNGETSSMDRMCLRGNSELRAKKQRFWARGWFGFSGLGAGLERTWIEGSRTPDLLFTRDGGTKARRDRPRLPHSEPLSR